MKRIVLLLIFFMTAPHVLHADANGKENPGSSNANLSKKYSGNAPSALFNLEGLPPVGNQVAAGSCYAWAAAYYYLTYLQWQEYGWDVTDPAHQCSPAFVYNLTNGGVDNGAWDGSNARRDAFRVFETMGCATVADLPYDYRTYRTFPTEQAFRNGLKFRTLSTHYITTRTDSGIQELKNHLLEGNIAVLGIYGYNNLDNIHLYNNTYCVNQARGSRLYWHEVTLVGYDDSLATADGVGAFRLVNEWGTGWGDRGFFWMSYQAVKNTKTSYGYAMYATDRIGYQPTLVARIELQHADRYNLDYHAGFGLTESPDTQLTFFNFSPMSLATGIPYPPGAIVLDFSDMTERIDRNKANKIFLSIHDKRANNNHSGTIESFMLEDLTRKLVAVAPDMPIIIPDTNIDAIVAVTLDYRFPLPQNFYANLDTISGQVRLTWDAPTDLNQFIDYYIYENGKRIDSTASTNYHAPLPNPGSNLYSVSARFELGESLQPAITLYRPVPIGLPFSDDFETCLIGWIQAGISELKAKIVDAPVYQGNHALALQTHASDFTAIARMFDPIEGAVFESWFNMESYPTSASGFGAGMWMTNQQGKFLGTFINNNGNPACLYPTASPQPGIEILDSTLVINLNQWYKYKNWYCNGKFHSMLLDNNWNVLLNKIVNFRDVQINQAGLFAWSLNSGWNYFDNFSIREWSGAALEHFTPINSTNQPYALIISEALLEGDTLQPGDEIAVFDDDLCVAAATVEGHWPLEMNAWQQVGDSPGFYPGNAMTFYIWNKTNNAEHVADASFSVGDGNFGYGIFSRLNLVGRPIVGVQELDYGLPKNFSISPAFPNPFNSTTLIILELPQASAVEVAVYNVMGQKLATLVNDHLVAGNHKIEFDAKNLSTGIYFIQTTIIGRINKVNKVLLMK